GAASRGKLMPIRIAGSKRAAAVKAASPTKMAKVEVPSHQRSSQAGAVRNKGSVARVTAARSHCTMASRAKGSPRLRDHHDWIRLPRANPESSTHSTRAKVYALLEVKMPRIRVQATSEPRLVAPVQAAQAATQRPERSDGESGVGPAPSHSSSFLVTL